MATQPTPVSPAVPVVVVATMSFSEESKASFVKAAHKALEANKDKLNRFQRRRAERLLKKDRFVQLAMEDCFDALYFDDPNAVSGLIDWENLDIDKLTQIFELIMKLISFLSELF